MGEQLSFKDIRVSKFGGEEDMARLSKEISKAYLQEITSQATSTGKKIALVVKIEFLLGNKIYVSNVLLGNAFGGTVLHSEIVNDFKNGNGENIDQTMNAQTSNTKWLDDNISNILALFNGCNGVTHIVKYQDTMAKIIKEYFGQGSSGSGNRKITESREKLKRDLILACNPTIPNSAALISDAGLTDATLLTTGQNIIIPITKKELDDKDVILGSGSELPAASEEIVIVERTGKQNNVYLNGVAARDATKLQVLDTLRREKPVIWHLTAHGVCGTIGYLATNTSTISDFEIRTLPLNYPNPDLTFLNICQGGIGGANSLAAAFVIAGSKNAIGGLWNLDDKAAKEFARLFYSNYFANPTLSITEILRVTQIEQRNTYSRETFWGAYIHLAVNYRKHSSIILGANEAKVIISQNAQNRYVATITVGANALTNTIILGAKTEIDEYISLVNNCVEFKLSLPKGSKIVSAYNSMWGRIDDFLQTNNITKVYFSPTGKYESYVGNQFSVNVLYHPNPIVVPVNKYVLDKYLVITLY